MVSTELIRTAARGMRAAPVVERDCAERVSTEMIEWAAGFGLLSSSDARERAAAIRVGQLAALTFARHTEDVLRLGADLILWLYLFDDAIGEAPVGRDLELHRCELSQFERVLRTGEDVRGDAFARSLLDLRQRATALGAGLDWHRRFADDMADYFAGCADEAVYRRAGVPPNLNVYRTLRAQTVGTSAVFAIAELGPGGQPTYAEMTSHTVVEARRIAAQLTAWVNDIFSYPKEAEQGDPMNLVAALVRSRHLEPAAAVQQSVAQYNADLERLEALVESIGQRFPSPALRRYMEDLMAWVHGNRTWTHGCGRYQASALAGQRA